MKETRRQAREWAVQMLTAADCDGDRMITVHDAVKLLASFQADSGQI